MVMCNSIVIVIVIIEHDGTRQRPGLPNAPVVLEQDKNRKER